MSRSRTRSGAWVLMLALLLPGVLLAPAPRASAAPSSCALPGPDADDYGCEVAAFDWRDASQGTLLRLKDDDASGAVSIGFKFPWHGADESFAYVGSNGLLCFDHDACSSMQPQELPDAHAPNGLVACFWRDLDPSRAGAAVHVATLGSSPDRMFVAQWDHVPLYGGSGDNTFQAQLREDGEARCMWKSVSADGGNPTSVGAEDATGTAGVRYAFADFGASQAGVRFFHCACTVPDAPAGLAVQRGPGPGQLRLAWGAPASDGGAPVRGYDVLRSSTSGEETLLASLGDVRNYTDGSLAAGSVWFYQVRARNFEGNGSRSEEVRGVAPTAPGAAALAARPGPGPNQITLTFAAGDDGGLAVRSFSVFRGSCGGCESFLRSVAPSGSFVDDVGCCTWSYRVAAVNDAGSGPLSGAASSHIPFAPTAPRSLAGAPGPGAGQVQLRWVAPADDGGLPVTGYRVWRVTGGGASLVADQAALAFTDRNLPAGSVQSYAVSARNGAGEGPRGGTVAVRVPSLPGPPQKLDAQPGADLGTVQLTWRAPADNGGLNLTKVRVYRGDASGAESLLATVGGAALRYTDTTPALLSVHYYRVAAVNPVGEGPASNEACGAPSPWGPVQPVTGQPCPLPPGWQERVLLDRTVPAGGDTPVTPAVDADVLSVDAHPAADPRYFVVELRVLGQPVPAVTLYTRGLAGGSVHQSFLHEPAHDLLLPGSAVRITVRERHDPRASVCPVALGATCLAAVPDPDADPFALGRAALLVDVRFVLADGAVAGEQQLVLPFGGALAAGLPPL